MARQSAAEKAEQDRAAAEQKVAEAQAAADAPGAGEDEQKALQEARAQLAAQPAQVSTRQYAPGAGWNVGDTAPENRYGLIDTDGTVKPTASNGAAEPKAGERAVIIVAKGDRVTASQRRQLGL